LVCRFAVIAGHISCSSFALDLRFRLLATAYAARIGAEDWRGAAEGRCCGRPNGAMKPQ
jgi:hypothetical protein